MIVYCIIINNYTFNAIFFGKRLYNVVCIGQRWKIPGTRARGGTQNDFKSTQKIKIILLHILYNIFEFRRLARSKKKKGIFYHVVFNGIGNRYGIYAIVSIHITYS